MFIAILLQLVDLLKLYCSIAQMIFYLEVGFELYASNHKVKNNVPYYKSGIIWANYAFIFWGERGRPTCTLTTQAKAISGMLKLYMREAIY